MQISRRLAQTLACIGIAALLLLGPAFYFADASRRARSSCSEGICERQELAPRIATIQEAQVPEQAPPIWWPRAATIVPAGAVAFAETGFVVAEPAERRHLFARVPIARGVIERAPVRKLIGRIFRRK
jgi:hypothetical protein